MPYVKVMFFNEKTMSFKGREYTYRCDLGVKPGDVVRVEAAEGTAVGRVSRIVEEEIGDIAQIRNVISVNSDPLPCKMEVSDPSAEDLIIVRQLPIIEERLHQLKSEIQAKVSDALSLACTEDTVKAVKSVRAELNALFKQLEGQRKAVKEQIMSPYNAFEEIYSECVSGILIPADLELKNKIDAVENGLKAEKRSNLKQYFDEYRDSLGVDPVVCDFDRAGINVRLSDSDKSLREKAKSIVDQIGGDIQTIRGLEHPNEIMTEYRVMGNLNAAIASVRERHVRIEAEQRRREEAAQREAERAAQMAAAEQMVDKVIEAPVMEMPPQVISEAPEAPEAPVEEELYIEFRVYGSIDQLKNVKKYLNDGGYKYEQL